MNPNSFSTVVFLGCSNMVTETIKFLDRNGLKISIVANPKQLDAAANAIAELQYGSEAIQIFKLNSLAQASPNDFTQNVAETIFVSVGAPWIIPFTFISSIRDNIVNLHGTHLPKDRGGNIFSWMILGERRVGMCAIHRLTPEIDKGEVLLWEEFLYDSSCRKPIDYIHYYEKNNIAFLSKFLKIAKSVLVTGATATQQPEYLSTYWPRLRSDINGWIDWTWTYKEIEKFICAFDEPYGGALTQWRGKTVLLRDVYSQSTDGYTHPFQQGIVYRNNGRWLNIAANGGELIVCSVKDSDNNDLISKIKPGDRLATDPQQLFAAKRRIVKSNNGLSVSPDF